MRLPWHNRWFVDFTARKMVSVLCSPLDMVLACCNDGDMDTSKVRVRRSIAEKQRIVGLTLQSGMSVARVAQAEGVNSHQVFQWRRAYRLGELVEAGERASAL